MWLNSTVVIGVIAYTGAVQDELCQSHLLHDKKRGGEDEKGTFQVSQRVGPDRAQMSGQPRRRCYRRQWKNRCRWVDLGSLYQWRTAVLRTGRAFCICRRSHGGRQTGQLSADRSAARRFLNHPGEDLANTGPPPACLRDLCRSPARTPACSPFSFLPLSCPFPEILALSACGHYYIFQYIIFSDIENA